MAEPASEPEAPPSAIDYPGPHDFVVVASDGVRFNLSRTVLAATSSFFADMFTLGESSSTESSQEQTIDAPENHVVLDGLFAISYSRPEKPKPTIETFAQIAELIRVAEKYCMHHALDYLSSHLTLPRIQGTTVSQPFTVTHPLTTLSLSLTQGFTLPARLALKEVVNASDSVWNTAFDDAELDGFTLDFRMLKKIHSIQNSRRNAYKSFIQNLQSRSGCGTSCSPDLPNWRTDLLQKFEAAPNSTAFGVAFYKGWNCSYCGQDLKITNSTTFATFVASQVAEESKLPELR